MIKMTMGKLLSRCKQDALHDCPSVLDLIIPSPSLLSYEHFHKATNSYGEGLEDLWHHIGHSDINVPRSVIQRPL